MNTEQWTDAEYGLVRECIVTGAKESSLVAQCLDLLDRNQRHLAALDSLAVEPSEDALSNLVIDIRNELTLDESQIAAQAFMLAHDAAHDERIRRECADRASTTILAFGSEYKTSKYNSPMIRKDLAAQLAKSAILDAAIMGEAKK